MAHTQIRDPKAMTSQMVAVSSDPSTPSVAVVPAAVDAGTGESLTFGTNVSSGGARSMPRPMCPSHVMLPRDSTAGGEATAPPSPTKVPLTSRESAPTQGTRDARSAAAQAPPPASPKPELANLFSEDVAGNGEPPQRSILPRPSTAVNLQEAMDSDVYSEATHPPASPTPSQGGSPATEQLPVISIEDEDFRPTDEELACLEVTKGWGAATSASSRELAAQVMMEEDKSMKTEEAEAASVLAQMGQGQKKMVERKSRNIKGLKLVIAEEPAGAANPVPGAKTQGNGEPVTSWADEPLDQFLPRPEAKEANLSSASTTALPPTPETTITTVASPTPMPTPAQTTTTAPFARKSKPMMTPTKPAAVLQTMKLSAAQIERLEAAQREREAKAGTVTTPVNTTAVPPPSRPTKPKAIYQRMTTKPTMKPLMTSSPTASGTSRSSSCGTAALWNAVSREEWDRELDEEIRRVETRRAKRLGGWHVNHPFIHADFETTDDEDDEVSAFIPEDGIVKCLANDPPGQGVGRVKNIKTSGKILASPSKPGKKKGKVNEPLKVKLFETVGERNEKRKEAQAEAQLPGKSLSTPKSSGVARKRTRKLVDDFEDVWPHAGKIAVGRRSFHLRRHWTKIPPPGIKHGWAAHQEFFSFVTAGIVAERLFERNQKRDEEAMGILESAYNGLTASSGKRMMELSYGVDPSGAWNKGHLELVDQKDQVAAAVHSAFILRKTLRQLLSGEIQPLI